MTLPARADELLREVQSLDGVSPEGAARALEAALEMADRGALPAPADVERWRELLAGTAPGPLSAEAERRLGATLDELAARLRPRVRELPGVPPFMRRAARSPGTVPLVEWMADAWGGAGGALGWLLAAYMAHFCGAPVPVFRAADADARAESSRAGRRRYLARLVREAVHGPGGALLTRSADHGASAVYRDPSQPGKQLIVHWHELDEAEERWSEAP